VIKTNCGCCKKEISVYPSRVVEGRPNFCSRECHIVHRRTYSSRRFSIDYEIDENGCFICTSHKPGKRGYPRMHEKLVFRHVYQEMFEPLQKGELVRHLCDNKLCINPEHLRKGTQMENVQDAIRNGRIRRGSQRPEALYDELQIYGVKVLMKNTDLTNSEIEYITKVSKCTIEGVRSGKQWKHVVV
jgi:hypothetical protein